MLRKKILLTACALMLAWAFDVMAQDVRSSETTATPAKTVRVTTMAEALLRPLPEMPMQLQSRPMQRAAMQRRHSVPRVSADYKMPAQIYGLMVYSKRWANGNGNGNYGVYTFTADKPNTMTAVVKDNAFAANGGAIYGNGRLNVLNYTDLWGLVILDYDYYQYSTQYWDLLQHVHQDDVTRLMSATGVYDPVTEKYYAAMYTDDMSAQVFGTLDYEKNSRTVIRQLPASENIAAMAINQDGVIYAIRFDGKLVQINKSTGKGTVVGSTGITPQYMQSAAIDPRTGRMFWAACSVEDPVGLYEVNLETGLATLIEEFKNSEELVGLYIPMPPSEEAAPAAPTTLTATFKNDSLQGTVNFRLPSKTYAGDAITAAELAYRVFIDGQLRMEAADAPGAMVHPVVGVDQSNMYRFEVCAVNEAGEGPRLHLDKFIGKDQPTAPTGVKLTKSGDGDMKLTWVAPSSTGVHKGYVNRDDLNYSVCRMPDSIVVAEHIVERTFTETIEPVGLTNYYYVVTAFNGDIEGLSAQSNRITLGSVVEPPYYEDFEDLSIVPNLYTFIDANKDGNTWRSGFWNGTQNSDIYYQYNEDQKTPADDWAITPPVHLRQGRFYNLSFNLNGYFLGDEKMSAWMGSDKTVDAMKTQLLDTQFINYSDPHTFTCLVKSDADGQYYFGFHAESDANQGILELDNIRIEESGVFEAPDTVTNFTVTPGANGARSAEIAFRAPTTNFYGQAIDAIDKIEVYREDKLIKTYENPAPGEELSFKESALPNSMVTWTVYTYNSFGHGIPAECKAWIGTDIPTEPTDLTLAMQGTTARLTWNAPTTGVHGGFIRPQSLTYNIEDMNFIIKGDHRSGTTFTENRGTKQDFLYYRVSAQSTAGGGNYAYSNTVICGTPYKLPFSESFANGTTDQLWSQQVSGGQIGLTTSIAADGDQGAALFKPDKNGDIGMITSGKINVSTAQHPILEFYYYAIPGQTTTLTVAVAPDGDADNLQTLQTIDYSKLTGDGGWRRVRASLEAYTATDHILLTFVGRATGSRPGDIAFDAITVREQDDVDMALQSLSVPANVEAGTTAKAEATVYNNGRLAVSGFKVTLKRNGKEIATYDGHSLSADAKAKVNFDIPTNVADQEDNVIEATVTAEGDGDSSNDKATATMLLDMPLLPAPIAVTGHERDGEMVIRWTAPDLTPRHIMASDDLERYQPFAIDGLGRWTTVDADGLQTGAIITSDGNAVIYDHVGEPMAYQVFRPALIGLEGVSALQPHSDSQMLINMVEVNNGKADDWLISPLLSGREQTVSFWVKSVSSDAIETFTVMASQTDDQPASFSAIEASATNAPTAWTEVTATLPEGTRYFAIRVNVKQKFLLMIDDLQYARYHTADLHLLGYNVYLEGERRNEALLTEREFREFSFGEADYRVTAVYEQGESALSQPMSYEDGIHSVSSALYPLPSVVYDLQGRRMDSSRSLPAGVYIQNGRKTVVK